VVGEAVGVELLGHGGVADLCSFHWSNTLSGPLRMLSWSQSCWP
jgi:hypothetical protein